MYRICEICQRECYIDMPTETNTFLGVCYRCVQVLHKITGKFSPTEFEQLRAAVLTGDLEQREFLDIMDKSFFAPN